MTINKADLDNHITDDNWIESPVDTLLDKVEAVCIAHREKVADTLFDSWWYVEKHMEDEQKLVLDAIRSWAKEQGMQYDI